MVRLRTVRLSQWMAFIFTLVLCVNGQEKFSHYGLDAIGQLPKYPPEWKSPKTTTASTRPPHPTLTGQHDSGYQLHVPPSQAEELPARSNDFWTLWEASLPFREAGMERWPFKVPYEDQSNKLTEDLGCGHQGLRRFRRIVGGTEAEECSFPWIVYISRDPGKDDLCGGSLVSNRHIITAAHCFDRLGDNWPMLTIGEYRREEENQLNKLVTASYTLSVHPEYDPFTYRYDIAILTLDVPIHLRDYRCIAPICLPSPDQKLLEGDTCMVAGWGSTVSSPGNHAVSSPLLMKTDVKIVNESVCKEKYRLMFDNESQICAGDLTGHTDSCVGDSGGPLMCHDSHSGSESPVLYLMGVVSSGTKPCAQEGKPAMYADVMAVREWINKVFSGG